jgi:hypothetical protein
VLIIKINEARMIGQTWSTGLTGRPNRSVYLRTESDSRFRDNLEGLNDSLRGKTSLPYIY